ncbi:hypothetical protein LVP1_g032 [Lactobacillus phage P1]|uniref:Uncharacterized protein n=1 Tax=Lactobacillus phage P1 TaxID=1846168 RepID=A0A1S5RCR4_9CAUD|nr:hypothetical protein HOR15_gp57 [Lactobacillus phage P1]ANO57961.1 hypothetical protein LVP1_g032 [Lactobacillus phage P1]APU93316.1 hypothetical protein LVP2_g042 [Lactobacillus phage P2]
MMKFMSAKEAQELSRENKEARVEYYLEDIEHDKKVQVIKREIEKTVRNGEDYVYIHFWTRTDDDRAEAIEQYFSKLGYYISFGRSWCRVRLFRSNLPKPPKISR